jgi:hypothetical protein
MMQEVTSSFPVHPLSHLIHKDSHPRGNIMKDLLVSRGYIQRLPGPHYTHTHTKATSCFLLFFFTHFSFFGRNLGSKPIPILSTAFFFYFIYPSLIIIIINIIIIFHSLLGFDIFKLLFKCIFYYVN